MLTVWLPVIIMGVVTIVQVVALFMLARYYQLAATESREHIRSFNEHLDTLEHLGRLSIERYRAIMRSLDQLMAIAETYKSQKQYDYAEKFPAPPPVDEALDQVRAISNSMPITDDEFEQRKGDRRKSPRVSSWSELRNLAKEHYE